MAALHHCLYAAGAASLIAMLTAAGGCGGKGNSPLDSSGDMVVGVDGSVSADDSGGDPQGSTDDSGAIFKSNPTDASSGACTGLRGAGMRQHHWLARHQPRVGSRPNADRQNPP